MAEAVAHGLCQPVGLYAGQQFAQLLGVVLVEGYLVDGVLAAVQAGHALHFKLLAGVGQVVARQVGHLERHASRIGHAQPATLRALRLDDDHAVGGLRAVDGLGRGVLQRRDALHLVHVEVQNLSQLGLEAVEDEQRLVGTRGILTLHAGDGRRTAHLEVGQCVRVRTGCQVLNLQERGVDVLQRLQHVHIAHALQFLALHRGHGASIGVGLAFEDTRHHDFVDGLRVGHELNAIGALTYERDAFRLEADVVHFNLADGVRERQFEVAVHVGDGGESLAVVTILHVRDGGSDERFPQVVDNDTRDLAAASSLLLYAVDGDQFPVDLVVEGFSREHHLQSGLERRLVNLSADAVGLHVLVGEHDFLLADLFESAQCLRQWLVLTTDCHLALLCHGWKHGKSEQKQQGCPSSFVHKQCCFLG